MQGVGAAGSEKQRPHPSLPAHLPGAKKQKPCVVRVVTPSQLRGVREDAVVCVPWRHPSPPITHPTLLHGFDSDASAAWEAVEGGALLPEAVGLWVEAVVSAHGAPSAHGAACGRHPEQPPAATRQRRRYVTTARDRNLVLCESAEDPSSLASAAASHPKGLLVGRVQARFLTRTAWVAGEGDAAVAAGDYHQVAEEVVARVAASASSPTAAAVVAFARANVATLAAIHAEQMHAAAQRVRAATGKPLLHPTAQRPLATVVWPSHPMEEAPLAEAVLADHYERVARQVAADRAAHSMPTLLGRRRSFAFGRVVVRRTIARCVHAVGLWPEAVALVASRHGGRVPRPQDVDAAATAWAAPGVAEMVEAATLPGAGRVPSARAAAVCPAPLDAAVAWVSDTRVRVERAVLHPPEQEEWLDLLCVAAQAVWDTRPLPRLAKRATAPPAVATAAEEEEEGRRVVETLDDRITRLLLQQQQQQQQQEAPHAACLERRCCTTTRGVLTSGEGYQLGAAAAAAAAAAETGLDVGAGGGWGYHRLGILLAGRRRCCLRACDATLKRYLAVVARVAKLPPQTSPAAYRSWSHGVGRAPGAAMDHALHVAAAQVRLTAAEAKPASVAGSTTTTAPGELLEVTVRPEGGGVSAACSAWVVDAHLAAAEAGGWSPWQPQSQHAALAPASLRTRMVSAATRRPAGTSLPPGVREVVATATAPLLDPCLRVAGYLAAKVHAPGGGTGCVLRPTHTANLLRQRRRGKADASLEGGGGACAHAWGATHLAEFVVEAAALGARVVVTVDGATPAECVADGAATLLEWVWDGMRREGIPTVVAWVATTPASVRRGEEAGLALAAAGDARSVAPAWACLVVVHE